MTVSYTIGVMLSAEKIGNTYRTTAAEHDMFSTNDLNTAHILYCINAFSIHYMNVYDTIMIIIIKIYNHGRTNDV